MVDISKIVGYQDIEEIRRITNEVREQLDLQYQLNPYKQIYAYIHKSKNEGKSSCDCYIDEDWLKDGEVEKFFTNQGYTFIANTIILQGSTRRSTTLYLSWAVNKIAMTAADNDNDNDSIEDFSRKDIERAFE